MRKNGEPCTIKIPGLFTKFVPRFLELSVAFEHYGHVLESGGEPVCRKSSGLSWLFAWRDIRIQKWTCRYVIKLMSNDLSRVQPSKSSHFKIVSNILYEIKTFLQLWRNKFEMKHDKIHIFFFRDFLPDSGTLLDPSVAVNWY